MSRQVFLMLCKRKLFFLYCFVLSFLGGNKRRVDAGNRITIKGVVMRNTIIDIKGKNNEIVIMPFARLGNLLIKVRGKGNRIVIGAEVVIVSGEMNIMGHTLQLLLGQGTTIRHANFSVIGEGTCVILGKDCMLGSNIKIWNGDVHPLYDSETGQELNLPQDIMIGDHVWLGSDVVILKGVTVGKGSVVGVRTLITKNVPENSLCVGSPAKVVKTGIEWHRRRQQLGRGHGNGA